MLNLYISGQQYCIVGACDRSPPVEANVAALAHFKAQAQYKFTETWWSFSDKPATRYYLSYDLISNFACELH